MSEYQLSGGAWVVRLIDNSRLSPDGEGWAEYQSWLGAGGVPLPPSAELLAETRCDIRPVSAWQIRKALNLLGWRDDVESFVAQSDQTTQDGWFTAKEFYRTDPLVVGVGQVLGKTEDEMDDFFRLADTL